jgi:hypothetical protein
MTLPVPFAYPTQPHQRRHGPDGYRTCSPRRPALAGGKRLVFAGGYSLPGAFGPWGHWAFE